MLDSGQSLVVWAINEGRGVAAEVDRAHVYRHTFAHVYAHTHIYTPAYTQVCTHPYTHAYTCLHTYRHGMCVNITPACYDSWWIPRARSAMGAMMAECWRWVTMLVMAGMPQCFDCRASGGCVQQC